VAKLVSVIVGDTEMKYYESFVTIALIASLGLICTASVDVEDEKFQAALERHGERLKALLEDEDRMQEAFMQDYEIAAKACRLTDVRSANHYAGTYSLGPQWMELDVEWPDDPNDTELEKHLEQFYQPENVICFRPEFNEHVVFWSVGNGLKQVAVKEFVFRTILDLPRKRILAFTMKGIVALPLNGEGKEQWLWRLPDRDDALMYHIKQRGFDIERPRFVFTTIQEANPYREMLAAWDGLSNKISQYEINESPDEVVWAGTELIVIRIGDKLIRAAFGPDGNCMFSEEKAPLPGWTLATASGGELVWLETNEDGYNTQSLRIGNVSIPWTDDRAFSLIEVGAFFYGTGDDIPDEDENGQQQLVFRLNREGVVTILEAWNRKDSEIYSNGAAGEIFWVASQKGQVRTYGAKRDAFDVQLPQQSYGKYKLTELLGDEGEWKRWSEVLPEFKK